jgi:hypothetical protein
MFFYCQRQKSRSCCDPSPYNISFGYLQRFICYQRQNYAKYFFRSAAMLLHILQRITTPVTDTAYSSIIYRGTKFQYRHITLCDASVASTLYVWKPAMLVLLMAGT